jgi:chromosome segregation ATPase
MDKPDGGKKPNFWDDFRAAADSLSASARILEESAARMRESNRRMEENTAKLKAANAELSASLERMQKANAALDASIKRFSASAKPASPEPAIEVVVSDGPAGTGSGNDAPN